MRAAMPTLRKLLPHGLATTAALLAAALRRNVDHGSTGAFSLVHKRKRSAEGAPGHTTDRTAQPAVPQHTLYVEAFLRDGAAATY